MVVFATRKKNLTEIIFNSYKYHWDYFSFLPEVILECIFKTSCSSKSYNKFPSVSKKLATDLSKDAVLRGPFLPFWAVKLTENISSNLHHKNHLDNLNKLKQIKSVLSSGIVSNYLFM